MIVSMIIWSNFLWPQKSEWFPTPVQVVVDTFYNNYVLEDNYRWLEKVNTDEVKDWVNIQNKLSKKYLSKIPKRQKIRKLIEDYASTDYIIPSKTKKYYFAYGAYNEISTKVLAYKCPGMWNYKVLVDPDDISLKDNIDITGIWVSQYESYLVYQFSRNGSDKSEARIVSLADGKHFPDHLEGLMFSNIEWYKDGFFYSTSDRTNEFGITNGQKVYYHKVGTGQFEDKLIFERGKYPLNRFSFLITSNQRYFILTENFSGKEKTNLFYFDLKTDDFRVKPLITNIKQDITILDNRNENFLAQSSMGSGNGILFEIDPSAPYQWKALTPGFSEAVLQNVLPLKDKIVASYITDHPILAILDYNKEILFSLDLPKSTSLHIIGADSSDTYLFYYYSSYTVPPIVYMLDLGTFENELLQKTEVSYDFNEIEINEVEYISNDGTKIPMTIVHGKDINLDGTNPTLLKAYGGFGIIKSPSFDPSIVYFIKQGGVFAFANIRGGGDKGKTWADAGSGKNKQQSFDDFIAAAEYLIEEQYTNPQKLATTGASNGGLVVAAAAIQRPDLFKVVVPKVAPLDMLRFEKFTMGHAWVKEYGTVKDSLSFTNLLSYSPYQNILEEINYPTMLIITSENDDRVPPFHSYKFAARLQNRNAQINPILLKVKKQAGHSGALTRKVSYKEVIDLYSFIINEFNK